MRATTPSSMAANPPRTYGISRLLLYDELHALHPQDTHGGVRLYDLPVGAARRPGLTVYIDGAGGQRVVDALCHAAHIVQYPVGIGGLDILFISLTTSGRVKASAAMDTAKNSPTCSHTGPPHTAAISPATLPRTNQMDVNPAVAASATPK